MRLSRLIAAMSSVAIVVSLGLTAVVTPAAQAATHPLARLVPKPDSAVKQTPQEKTGPLGSFAPASQAAIQQSEGAAIAAAARTGHPVAVAGLQTESETMTAAA